jgi:hypothetical protein
MTSRNRPISGLAIPILSIALLLVLAASELAQAQSTALERNLPEAPRTSGGDIRVDAAIAGSTDETPLGIDVTGITLIGQDIAVPQRPSPGVSIEGLEGRLRSRRRFRPLSASRCRMH